MQSNYKKLIDLKEIKITSETFFSFLLGKISLAGTMILQILKSKNPNTLFINILGNFLLEEEGLKPFL